LNGICKFGNNSPKANFLAAATHSTFSARVEVQQIQLKFRTVSQAKISHGDPFDLGLRHDFWIPEKIESATYRYYAA
jgi:hypothetical protein